MVHLGEAYARLSGRGDLHIGFVACATLRYRWKAATSASMLYLFRFPCRSFWVRQPTAETWSTGISDNPQQDHASKLSGWVVTTDTPAMSLAVGNPLCIWTKMYPLLLWSWSLLHSCCTIVAMTAMPIVMKMSSPHFGWYHWEGDSPYCWWWSPMIDRHITIPMRPKSSH